MDISHCFDNLNLDDKTIGDENIDSAIGDVLAFIENPNRMLAKMRNMPER